MLETKPKTTNWAQLLSRWRHVSACEILISVKLGQYEDYALTENSSLYGSETWRLTENNRRRVEATEMDALRR